MLRDAGVEAEAAHRLTWRRTSDRSTRRRRHRPEPHRRHGLLDADARRARQAGAAALHISGIGNGGELEPSPRKRPTPTPPATRGRSAPGADRHRAGRATGALDAIPSGRCRARPAGAADRRSDRLVELIGAGPNAWTAQEGALKIREASYVAAEGLSSEQFFHGPSVALDGQDTLVVLDGGGPAADRTEAIAGAVQVTGARVAVSPSATSAKRCRCSRSPWWAADRRGAGRGARRQPRPFRYEEDPRREAAFEALGF